MAHLLADLRYALRSLRRVPLFTAVAVLSIAFGIGANTAVFTLVDQVILRKMAVVNPGEIVHVTAAGTEQYGGSIGDGTELSYPMYRDLRDHNPVFSGMLCRASTSLTVGYGGRTEVASGELVSGNFFTLLGLNAAEGRLLNVTDDPVGGGRAVAVLGHDYFRTRFNGDRGIIGRTLIVNGHPFEIVGVVDRQFHGLDLGNPVQVYVPVTMQPKLGPSWLQIEGRRFRWVQVYARLKPGISAAQAQAGVLPLYRSILKQEATDAAFSGASAETKRRFLAGELSVNDASRGRSGFFRSVRDPLLILMAVAAGVLLIVSANVANLLIARGAARHRELALRLAVGASRRQIVRMLLVESLVLSVAGAALGVLVASWSAGMLLGYFVTPESPIAVTADADARIMAFTALLAVVTALVAGIVPAFRSTGMDIAPTLKSSGGAVVSEQPTLRKTLVVAQVALSFLLLIGAGLFLRSLENLLAVDPGFRTSHVLSFSFDLERNGYQGERSRTFARTLQDALRNVPGVASASYAFFGLLEGGGWGMGFTVEGYQPSPGDSAGAMCNGISPGFFKEMGVPLVAGREFDARDDAVQPPPEGWPYRVAVVNQTFVKRYFKDGRALGRHIGIGDDPGTAMPIEIVGVVKDMRYTAIREDDRAQVFFPYLQATGVSGITAYARTEGETDALMGTIRRRIADLDPGLALYNVSTLEGRVERSVVNERLIASLSSALSAMATVLSVVGLYGVMAYTVTRRTREIGIRMALGALASQIAMRVLREAAVLVTVGLVLGFVAAWWLGRYVQGQLYGVTPADTSTIVLAGIALSTVAAIAAMVPARRASRIAPMSALRDE
jgi:putative ABC transport system permease protein